VAEITKRPASEKVQWEISKRKIWFCFSHSNNAKIK
jgi:hypothetical protein